MNYGKTIEDKALTGFGAEDVQAHEAAGKGYKPATDDDVADYRKKRGRRVVAPKEGQVRYEKLRIADIKMDGGTQSRRGLSDAVCREYAALMEDGETFPPVVVYFDGTVYWLSEGFHRTTGAMYAGLKHIKAEVRVGGRREALLNSLGSNRHGLPRSNADKRHAVWLCLNDAEWSKWSDREIARACGVGHRFVGDVRRELSVNRSQIDGGASGSRSQIDGGASANGSQMRGGSESTEVWCERAGKAYLMKIDKLVEKAREEKERAEAEAASQNDAATDPPPEPEPEPPPPPIRVDGLGIPLNDDNAPYFDGAAYAELRSLLRQAGDLFNALAQSPAGVLLRRRLHLQKNGDKERWRCSHIDQALSDLKFSEPYCSVCPYCYKAHPGKTDRACKACFGFGVVNKDQFGKRGCPQECQDAVKALAVLPAAQGEGEE